MSDAKKLPCLDCLGRLGRLGRLDCLDLCLDLCLDSVSVDTSFVATISKVAAWVPS